MILPYTPVHNIRARIKLDGKAPKALWLLPKKQALTYTIKDKDYVEFFVPRLETFAMFALDYI